MGFFLKLLNFFPIFDQLFWFFSLDVQVFCLIISWMKWGDHGSIILWWYWNKFFLSSFEVSFSAPFLRCSRSPPKSPLSFRSPNLILFYILEYYINSPFLKIKRIIGIVMIKLKEHRLILVCGKNWLFPCFLVNLVVRVMQLFVSSFFIFW